MSGNRHVRRRETSAQISAFKVPPPAVRLLVLLGLLAVFIQSFVVQTHVHIPRLEQAGLTAVQDGVPGSAGVSQKANPPHDKYPADEDPSNCPLCQEFTHSGVFLTSATVVIALPFYIAFDFIVFVEARPSLLAPSHNWQGRAPPAN